MSLFRRQKPTYTERAAEPYRAPLPRPASETPLFDQAVYATGVEPRFPLDTDDALLDELDLLALPIATGTLRGRQERAA